MSDETKTNNKTFESGAPSVSRVIEHTPTPWHLGAGCLIHIKPATSEFECIAHLPIGERTFADAEFIVRAANSYDEMLEALKAADHLLGYFHWDSASGRSDKFELVQKIRAAIAKAAKHD